MKLVSDQLIGCDPEFIIANKGRLVTPWTPFQVDGVNWTDYAQRKFGSDGQYFELRPDPSTSTFDLTYKIKKLLMTGKKYIKGGERYSWFANPSWHRNHRVGGHIHIGGTHTTRREEALQRTAECIEECDLIPKDYSRKRREIYGETQIRDDHSDEMEPHWEFRWLGTWLFHPKVTFAVLTLAKLSQVDTKKTVSLMNKRQAFGSLMELAMTYQEMDSDANRLFNLLSLGPEKVLAPINRSFITSWTKWSPGGGLDDSTSTGTQTNS